MSKVKIKTELQKFAQKGGKACLKKYGKKHFRKMGKLSWKKRKQKKS